MIPRFCFSFLMQLYFLMNSSFWFIAHHLMCWFEPPIFADWLVQSGRKVWLITYSSFGFFLLFSHYVRLLCLHCLMVSTLAQSSDNLNRLEHVAFFFNDDSTVLLLTFDAIVLPDEQQFLVNRTSSDVLV